MDRTNKKILDNNFTNALATNRQKFYQEKMDELSTSGRYYTQDELKSKSTAYAKDKVAEGKPQLEATIYQDYGGSQEAAQKQFKEWQRKKVEKYLEERKKRPENQKKLSEQQKAIKAKAKQKAADSLARMKKRKEFKQNFNSISKNTGNSI